MTLKVKSLGGASALACGLLFVVAIWPACACLPMEYREVDPAAIPAPVAAHARAIAPGFLPKRAWAFGPGPMLARGVVDGYLIRGRAPGWWRDRDVKVGADRTPPDEAPVDLRPLD